MVAGGGHGRTVGDVRTAGDREVRAGEQRLRVPCSATPFSDGPKRAGGLVTLRAWEAPQTATRPPHAALCWPHGRARGRAEISKLAMSGL